MNMDAEDVVAIESTFQVAGASRLLLRVPKICDQGLLCTFDSKEARVLNVEGEVIASFKRDGGGPSHVPDGAKKT